ncbi:Uncharacterized protein APZ42_015229 [Daphnia magna]|uniref:Uncharacterized protein n=2 Tax=Daphnia magna TaxID=35525 RepID=A0A162PAJ5_9CRUS|nr:hypothetical protein OUZ56_004292 [Daphnia magna]KZS18680.1 Uncharacterized protein APZ42_015229 [Daphnia magna]
MRYFLIFICLVFVFASIVEAEDIVTVGGNPCTWGPSFWCHSFENAEECGVEAIQYCESVNWSVE